MYVYEMVIKERPKYIEKRYKYNDSFNEVEIEMDKNGIIIKSYYKGLTNSSLNFVKRYQRACMLYLNNYDQISNAEIASFNIIDNDSNTIDLLEKIKEEISPNDYELLYKDKRISDNILNKYLYQKSKSPIQIAIHSLTISKTKKKYIDRLIFLWIALNGIYNTFSSKVIDSESKKMKEYNKVINSFDYEIMGKVIRDEIAETVVQNIDNIESTEKSKLYKNIIEKMIHSLNKLYNDNKLPKQKSNIEKRIECLNKIKSPEEQRLVIMFEFGYYYRCKYFHGDKRLDLFYEDKKEKKIIELLNNMIEDEIINNLNNIYEIIDNDEEKRRLYQK